MLCILENSALQKDAYLCLDLRVGDFALLSSTCSIANISEAMVDSSPIKLMHKLFRDALYIHVSADGYLWSRFNSVKLSTIATLIAPMVVFGKWD